MNTINALTHALNALRTIASGDSERLYKYAHKNVPVAKLRDRGTTGTCALIAQDALDRLEGTE